MSYGRSIIPNDWQGLEIIINEIENEILDEQNALSNYMLANGSRDLSADWVISTHNVTLTNGKLTAKNIDCSGTIAGGTITGINVTSGADPGHTHTSGAITEADPVAMAYLDQAVKQASSPTFAGLTIGTLSITEGSIEDSSGNIALGTTDITGIGSHVAGDFTSLVSTGTAPFFCDSTTLCSNLNADMLDGQHASEFQAAGSYQPWAANLVQLSDLTFVSTSFVKMTAAGTFSLDTNTYLTTISGLSHTLLADKGTNTHAQIDTHIADATKHFTQGSIDHTAITNIGTLSHATIDSYLDQAVKQASSPTFASLLIGSIKSGADQTAAGAAANEIWKTASHATLPDNVLMIGV